MPRSKFQSPSLRRLSARYRLTIASADVECSVMLCPSTCYHNTCAPGLPSSQFRQLLPFKLKSNSSKLLLTTLALPLRLLVPLAIDARCERILKAERNLIYDQDQRREREASRLTEPDGRAQERHGRAVVHRRVGHVEWESSHHLVHQDAKVVAQVRPRDAERPHRGEDEDVSARDERGGDELGEGSREEGMSGLVAEGALVAGECQ